MKKSLLVIVSLLLAADCGGITSGGDDRADATAKDSAGGGRSGATDADLGLGAPSGSSGGPSSGSAGFGSGAPGPLSCPAGAPLSCYVNTQCANGAHTTLTGKVFDPAGQQPLSNVIVFVPNDPSRLPPITPGTSSCETCAMPIGDYVAAALTDRTGSFTLTDVPTGKNVPLVVQIGKWRRTITVADIADCKTTTLPTTGTGLARLPRNHHEGDMPQMALLTGGLDDLGCFLTRVGIDATEYSAPRGGGRVDVYQGLGNGLSASAGANGPGLSSGTAGDCTTTSCPLWSSKQSLEGYDLVLLACEGDTFDPDATPDGGVTFGNGRFNVTKAGKQAMHDWLGEGGRVLATHFNYTWFQNGPPDFQGVASWLGSSVGSGTCNCSVDVSFPRGQVFHDWLQTVGGLIANGTISLSGVAQSVGAVSVPTTRWIYDPVTLDTKYFSFETPIGGTGPADDSGALAARTYCGKAAFTDLHAGGAPSGDVPGSCKQTALTPQEKALEFLFFDLASCVTTVTDTGGPPPIPPPI